MADHSRSSFRLQARPGTKAGRARVGGTDVVLLLVPQALQLRQVALQLHLGAAEKTDYCSAMVWPLSAW